MPCLLYYRPRQTNPVTLSQINEWGLGYAFFAEPEQTLCQGDTPDGSTGTVFHDAQRAGDMSLKLDMSQQTWDVCAATGCYVGYWNDFKPTPADLARPQQLRGYPVQLADGQEWRVPLVRQFDEHSSLFEPALPVAMKCGTDGKWSRGEVRAIHRRLWDVVTPFAEDFAAQIAGAVPSEFSDEQVYAAVVEILQANYVVGAGELSLLGSLYDNQDVRRLGAIYAACDSPTFLRWLAQKKTKSK